MPLQEAQLLRMAGYFDFQCIEHFVVFGRHRRHAGQRWRAVDGHPVMLGAREFADRAPNGSKVRDHLSASQCMGQYPMVTFRGVEILCARKQNAHIKWAFSTSLNGLDVGCAGKI